MTPLLSDLRLARQASDGDQRAFEAIYKRYHQEIYRFCLSILGRPEDAQEALQNTMVKALRSLPGERREIKLKPWLYRVAHNESIDLLRRRREGAELDEAQASSGAEITETVALRERLGRLLADLGELPERQRSALLMRELGGLDYGQIGAAFESSPAVARQTVYEARLGLRELEAGREMSCERVTRRLSEGDGRIGRRRDIRAHLRACPDCRAFRDSIEGRRGDLQALAPLPAAAAASILHGLLGGNVAAGSGLGGAAGAAGAGAGKAVGTSLVVKAVATVAVAATIGVTAADRAGLVNVGLPGGGKSESSKSVSGSSGSGSTPAVSTSGSTTAHGNADAIAPTGQAGIDTATPAKGHGHTDTSRTATTTPAETPTQSPGNDKSNGNGPPTSSGEASQHGQETAAAHKATGKGKAKDHPAHPSHPSAPSHSKGRGKAKNEQAGGQAKGKQQAPQPSAEAPTKSKPAHSAEPPSQEESEAPPEATEHGKGEADESESEPSP
jgi:RNA polymerase sigma factor (sigma-70 family)